MSKKRSRCCTLANERIHRGCFERLLFAPALLAPAGRAEAAIVECAIRGPLLESSLDVADRLANDVGDERSDRACRQATLTPLPQRVHRVDDDPRFDDGGVLVSSSSELRVERCPGRAWRPIRWLVARSARFLVVLSLTAPALPICSSRIFVGAIGIVPVSWASSLALPEGTISSRPLFAADAIRSRGVLRRVVPPRIGVTWRLPAARSWVGGASKKAVEAHRHHFSP